MSRRPHICHVFSSFDPGGPELRAVTLINRFGDEYEHTIIATNGHYGAANRLRAGVPVRFLDPPEGKGGLLYGLALLPLLRSTAPDIVATYNWGAIDAVIASELVRSWPVIHSEDGLGVDELTTLKTRRVLTRRLLLNRIYATIVPSKTLLALAVQKYKVKREKITLIYNGVDLDEYQPRRSYAWREAAGIPNDAVVIGTVGALRPEKNLGFLLDTFATAAASGAYVVIVGDGPCREPLEAQARALSIEQRVLFVGNQTNPAEYYAGMDVFTLSSATEQMPIALLEAMASGLPVVATDVGDVADMLDETRAPAIVPAGDRDAYARALTMVGRDAQLRQQLGVRNRRRVESEYGLDRMTIQYQRLYAEAAAGRPFVPSHA